MSDDKPLRVYTFCYFFFAALCVFRSSILMLSEKVRSRPHI
ncbi:hypothetical protein [Nostoc sp. ChiQUE01b]|nr:hypothetical protein [Nostoc sp. ChiQUE01b]